MAAYGKIDEFDEKTDEWSQYIERLGHYFLANEVDSEDKQKAILLSVVGSKTYKLMSSLVAPLKPGEKSFEDLVTVVQNHHYPKPSEIVQRFKFNSRFRKQGESVSEFVNELRQISKDCKFEGTLEAMLLDRLVCGINNDAIQRRLLSEDKLEFKKAFELSTAMETANKNVHDLQLNGPQSNNVHKLKKTQNSERRHYNPPPPPTLECYKCGESHRPNVCPFKDAECFYCHKKGHLAVKCRKAAQDKRQQATAKPKFTKNKKKGAKTFVVDAEIPDEDVYTMFRVLQTKSDPYRVNIKLNGIDTQMEVDTGASVSVISEKTLKHIRKGENLLYLQQTGAKLRTYTNEDIPVKGKVETFVQYKSQTKHLPIIVVNGNGPSLLGQIKLDWCEIKLVKTDKLSNLLDKYEEVFQEGLGTVKGTTANIYVDSDAAMKYCKARPVAYAVKEKIETELNRLVAEGTIEPVEFAEWAAPIVPIIKQDKTVRICGDYKVTVNQHSKLDNYPIPKIDDLYAELSGGEQFTKLDMSQAYQQLLLDDESKDYIHNN